MRSLLRIKVVLARTGLSRSTMYAMIADGRFPAPVKLSVRCVAWPSDQVDAWVAERIAA
ncbi:helix-turn-helix transcriptional regulator [Aeromonas caviae]|uniref:helix-turn-helix transcriptional regulator n=1 Tax=Aeromonas caviae TaxID=648 RepID=UPI002B45FE67|nr:AlpA family transcriptional regulator [Aeromonas caviae]